MSAPLVGVAPLPSFKIIYIRPDEVRIAFGYFSLIKASSLATFSCSPLNTFSVTSVFSEDKLFPAIKKLNNVINDMHAKNRTWFMWFLLEKQTLADLP